ncbi:unnamed protein product [Cylicocyclus nassatus]|uniref:SERTA domain-containing protein n=1 Tax=Cylicocyclus nassatus TaxID=53992 RepID=A0AA36DJM9_CYLNA|nr:unnamed protein product [Cylicocyclus nassatus]
MVLCASYNSRAHSSILPYDYDDCDDGDVCRYEVPTSMPRGGVVVPTSQPISLRSPYSTDDDLADSPPMERLYSPLSSSAESISSIKSSSSSRSSAEREIERQQRRQLLDASLLKMRASNNMPLRKHLLVYNTVKQLQRDLDLLDDEELYCNLMGEGCGERMDVDERRWPSFGGIGGTTGSPCMTMTSSSLPSLTSSEGDVVVSSAAATAAAVTSATATVAPPQQEERRVAEEATSLISDDLDMDVCQQMPQQQQQAPTWSWTTTDTTSTTTTTTCGGTTMTGSGGFHLFESIQDALGESFAGWSWSTDDTSSYSSSNSSTSSNSYSSSDLWWSAGGSGSATPFGATSRLDSLWGVGADPLGAANLSRFELQHLFPSQVLLQA